MISVNDTFSLCLISALLLSSLLWLWFAAIMPGIDRWSKRFFLSYFGIDALCCLAALADICLQYLPVPSAALYGVVILETWLLSLPLPLLTVYLLHCCGQSWRPNSLMYAVLSLWVLFCILLASNHYTGIFGFVTPERQFLRSPWYPLLQLPVIAILLLNLAGVAWHRRQLSPKVFRSFLIALLPMTFVLIVNLLVDALLLFDISFVLAALAMYGLVMSDEVDRDLRHQREIARQQQKIANQRASIMVLKMRPHFIYNALMCIYSLCSLDPQKAQRVTADFAEYLRKNFNAVASEEPVPFSSELEHARAYLAVEQAQYEDMLAVGFDTPHVGFRLPPLTLQPLVENAVKHGMGHDTVPLRVAVRTRETNAGSEVVVEDNGPGFDVAIADDPSTTLANIRQRLEMMCGGTLEIAPREGGGTVAKVTIPQRG